MKTLAPVREYLAPHEPWYTPGHLARVFTYRIAARIAGDGRNVCAVEETHKPPFCLRLRPAYRTPAAQAFRDTVARIARETRNAATWTP